MRNLKIGKKLMVVFSIIIVLFVVTVILSSAGLNYSGEQFNDFYTYSYPMSNMTVDIRREIQSSIKSLSMSMLTEDEQASTTYISETENGMQKVQTNLDYLLKNYRGDTSRINEAVQLLNVAGEYRKQIQELAAANKNSEAAEIFFNQYYPEMLKVQELITSMDENTTILADGTFASAHNMQIMINIAVIGISIVVLVVTLILAAYLTRSLTKPISEIEEAAKQMAEGSLSVEIAYESRDEMGSLSESMRVLCGRTSQIVVDIGHILAALAEGNFHIKSHCLENYVGDYVPILTAMRLIRDNLNETMTQINQSADQVASGSDQVSGGAQALSQGATEQASSIEELAATVNDISGQVKLNADHAKEASEKANSVGMEVNESNTRMQNMLNAMSDISNSSNEIGKIIKTIEDIAFQTNILALNAAVEAARAGEAGKGFAVVADEVRNLASKSAEASKNTSVLIEGSLRAVDNGTRIADETAQSLSIVVSGVKEVSDTIGHIAEASDVQATSIVQVTQGIDQISSVVQTNSATAEESAAASEELSGQAQLLKELVGKFRLLDNRAAEETASARPKPAKSNVQISSSGDKY